MLFALAAAASLLSLSPQAPRVPLPSPALVGFHLVATTARVDYFAMSDSPAKAGDARQVEALLEAIEKQMGLRGPARWPTIA